VFISHPIVVGILRYPIVVGISRYPIVVGNTLLRYPIVVGNTLLRYPIVEVYEGYDPLPWSSEGEWPVTVVLRGRMAHSRLRKEEYGPF